MKDVIIPRMYGNMSVNVLPPPHLLGPKELVTSNNLMFDYEKGALIKPRAEILTLVPDSTDFVSQMSSSQIPGVGYQAPSGDPDCVCHPDYPTACGITPPWLTGNGNLPYVNSGNNVDGFIELYTPPDYFLQSQGGVLTTVKNNGTAPRENARFLQRIPAKCGGNFLFTAEVQMPLHQFHAGPFVFFCAADYNTSQRFAVSNSDGNVPLNRVGQVCDMRVWNDYTAITDTESALSLDTWTTIEISRIGNLFSFRAGGQTMPTSPSPLTGTGYLVLSMNFNDDEDGTGLIQWRNISIVNI